MLQLELAQEVKANPTVIAQNVNEVLLGHAPIDRRPNIRKELVRLRRDPLEPLLRFLDRKTPNSFSHERMRYREAYRFYYLSVARFLREMSIAARFQKGPYWARRYHCKFTVNQRKLAGQYGQIAPFLEYDIVNCLIHSRILLDRVASISRSFLTGKHLPSFTSFGDHRKLFRKLTQPYGDHEEYAAYFRSKLSWFDMPVKLVRDKFVVHASPKHFRVLGYWHGGFVLDLSIIPSEDSDNVQRMRPINVSPLRLSHDIEDFLKWFCRYGLAAQKSEMLHKQLDHDALRKEGMQE